MHCIPQPYGEYCDLLCQSRRATSLLVRLVEGEERWEAPDHPQGVFPQNCGGIEPSHTVTCMVLKAAVNDKSKSSLLPWMNFVGIDLMLISVTADQASQRAMLLARWIVRSVLLEIVGSSGHEKVPTCGKPGLERSGRPRGERIEGSCGKHLWTPQ
ncbi:hypothetical protein TNCV_3226461 [Trichonephila clavipes]|nr:hypothetical protein TNCV_3226461 [Trichonephila clavipes]